MDNSTTGKQLEGCKIILCTLSLLANSRLRDKGYMRIVPIDTVVVDEASQIEIGNYIPLLSNYSSIRKICFFGDDRQRVS
jgi:superfamily I DNA and/or RNA helicase